MSADPQVLTLDVVRAQVLAVCDAHPDNVNPTDDIGVCLYDDGDGRHCVVGQWRTLVGLDMPSDNANATLLAERAPDEWPVDGAAAGFLGDVQVFADGNHDDDPVGQPHAWSEVAAWIRAAAPEGSEAP